MTEHSPKPDIELESKDAVRACDLYFSYARQDMPPVQALAGLSLSIQRGEHVVFVGRNGSGKSTLAKLINVLEAPDEGTLEVLGLNALSEDNFWSIRSRCGMVFQNPDNQIVGTSVEEDVAFGPENLGVPTPEIRRRVDDALKYVGLSDYADRLPSSLSGGQKQKLAIAGVLAMMPEVLILDESTAMLDPISRNEFLLLVERLRSEKGITVVHITHDMSEAARGKRVFVLEKGRLVMEGPPSELFLEESRMKELGLDVPVYVGVVMSLCRRLGKKPRQEYLQSVDTAIQAVRSILRDCDAKTVSDAIGKRRESVSVESTETVLQVRNLSHAYEERGEKVLCDISFSVKKGEIFSVIGHSGSGKTTLISHLNGLIRPQTGDVELFESANSMVWNTRKNSDVKEIRKRVGLLFQYPEYQLFEETVRKDILFGPLKMGVKPEAAEDNMKEAIGLVGLDETYLERSPFELSGGQKRRVAFAGIIAMNPDILVLDEPAAGLDPVGRRDVFRYIGELRKLGKTIILVSHNMDEAARISDRMLVLSHGKAICEGTPEQLFSGRREVADFGLELPELVSFEKLLLPDYPDLNLSVYEVEEAVDEILRAAVRAGKSNDKTSHEPDPVDGEARND